LLVIPRAFFLTEIAGGCSLLNPAKVGEELKVKNDPNGKGFYVECQEVVVTNEDQVSHPHLILIILTLFSPKPPLILTQLS